MPEPQTLLQMYGAPLIPNRLAESVLVIVDAQNDYRDKMALDGIDAAVAVNATLLTRARQTGTPVIHVVQQGSAGGAFDLSARGGAIFDELTPLAGETVVVKTLPNSFAGTELLGHLQAIGRSKLIVTGFMTHMCVSTTTRASIDYGFWSTVVADATATRPLPDPYGGPFFPAETVQRAALAELADRFAIVAKSGEIPD